MRSHTKSRPGHDDAVQPAGCAYRQKERKKEKRVDRDDDEEGDADRLQAMVLWRTEDQMRRRRTGMGSKPVPGERRGWQPPHAAPLHSDHADEREHVNGDAEDAETIYPLCSVFHEFH